MGHTGFKGLTEQRKRYYNKHKKLGLCVNCSKKAKKGRVRCEYHLKIERKKHENN